MDFDATSSRQVVVGRNGVGKSNLLEALARIFRQLDLEEEATFGYEIEYHCNGFYVKIRSEAAAEEASEAHVRYRRFYYLTPAVSPEIAAKNRPYKSIKQNDFYGRNRAQGAGSNPDRVIPLYVFGYYSGTSSRFAELFGRHEEIYYREQITGEEAPLRPLFLARPHHSQFALLSFFAANDEPAKKFLREEFQITGLESVLFSLHEPYWRRGKKAPSANAGDDERFWGAGGKVAPFLTALFTHSLAPMTGKSKRRVSIGQERNFDMRYCYVPSEAALRSLADGLEPKEFFARLESTIFSDVIAPDGGDVRIRVKVEGCDGSITFRELSEGEQQLLTIIGLMRFTAQNESLFLLDEPDTHLNPAWCLDYLENLRRYGVEPPQSQILMTTHSPLTFAGLEEDEVVILSRGADGAVISQHPLSPPRGMGFQAILTSEFFGLRSGIDRETLVKIDRKRELGFMSDRTPAENNELAALDEELGRLDFSKAARDPLYLEYIRAMTQAQIDNPELAKPAPTPATWEMRAEIAKEISKKILEANKIA
ncbi:ATP-binding protein [Sphingomonas yunnanensis]|nr:ATP-binding protein [Sphingomonas yunnanensis]